MKLTQQDLQERYAYNPRTGFFKNLKTGSIVKGVLKSGYRRLRIQGQEYRYHRLVWLYVEGEWPTQIISFKNGNRGNCSWRNLREISYGENAKRRSLNSRNTSGQAGVHFCKQREKWIASISLEGVKQYLGSFTSKTKAITIRKQAEKKHGFKGSKKGSRTNG